MLSTFAGLHNPPAVPQDRTADQLARYVGTYTGTEIQLDGTSQETAVRIGVSGGGLAILGPDGKPQGTSRIAFYRGEYAVVVTEAGALGDARMDFILAPDGTVSWLRSGGRMLRWTA